MSPFLTLKKKSHLCNLLNKPKASYLLLTEQARPFQDFHLMTIYIVLALNNPLVEMIDGSIVGTSYDSFPTWKYANICLVYILYH